VLREELTRNCQHLVAADWPRQEDNAIVLIVGWCSAARAKHQHRQIRLARTQFGHKSRSADSRRMVPCDDQAKIVGKIVLLNKAKRFGSVGHSAHITEMPAENRHHQGCLEGIIVDDKYICHWALVADSGARSAHLTRPRYIYYLATLR
jgi:hypothetical protein